MSDDSSNPTTPKRKRGENGLLAPIKFSFDVSKSSAEDGNSSPRSKVAHRFRGLALGSEGGAATPDDAGADVNGDDVTGSPAKRPRAREIVHDDVPEPVGVTNTQGKTVPQPESAPDVKETTEGSVKEAYPSIHRLDDTKSRAKKRSGTPPLRLRKGPTQEVGDGGSDSDSGGDEGMEVVDPVRAALTWHEHEITVYDPDDEDDDGTGINGIGFKPTPALAHARAMKRRQQMAEYRKREESDARAKRSQRRRGGGGPAPAMAAAPVERSPERKVRFTETEHPNLAITTG